MEYKEKLVQNVVFVHFFSIVDITLLQNKYNDDVVVLVMLWYDCLQIYDIVSNVLNLQFLRIQEIDRDYGGLSCSHLISLLQT